VADLYEDGPGAGREVRGREGPTAKFGWEAAKLCWNPDAVDKVLESGIRLQLVEDRVPRIGS
jgi:hypothetical protein